MKNTKEEIEKKEIEKKEIPTDQEITHYWKRKNCFGNYLEGLEHGSIWMRDEYTTRLTDQIKSMENYISDVDGQVKDKNEEIARLRFDYDACYGQLESLQKEVIEFAEWLDKEGYYRLNDGRWSINILGRANEEFTTQELYKIYKPS